VKTQHLSPAPAILCAAGVAALAFALYAPSLRNPFSNFDDPTYVLENPWIRELSWANFARWWTKGYFGNYAPFTLASYALDHALWGLRPAGYHLTNVLLHAATCALLLLALVRCGAPLPAATLGALVFAAHPGQVESVAWIAQRKTLLATFFLLLSYLAYLRAARSGSAPGTMLALSWAAFVVAGLSKVTVVVFPAVLLLQDVAARRASWPRLLAEKVPFLIAAGAIALAGYREQVAFQVTTNQWLGGTPWNHAATMASLLARYARIVLLPVNLSVLYEPPDARSVFEPWVLAGVLLLALGAAAFLLAWRRAPAALPWMGFFWLGFLPVSQIVPYTVHMADRYLHVPMLGVAAAAGAAGIAVLRGPRAAAARAAAAVALALALLCFGTLTVARQAVWRDPVSLWSDAVRKPPVSWVAWYNHGRSLDDRGDVHAAIASYERALELNPRSVLSLTNLGKDYAAVGRGFQAEAALRRAMALPLAIPADRARAAILLGELLVARGRAGDAIAPLQRAAAWAPRSVPARLLLARALRALGRDAEARRRIDQALAIDPRSAEAWLERGILDARAGREEAARADYERALALAPEGPLRARIRAARDALARQ
jgi:tetratricopeptide (TPR) repeat protein